jgi:hypothetical protein
MSHTQNYSRSINGTNPELLETADEILEIQKIEYQQKLIAERMRHLDFQKKQLEKCLNALQSMDSDDD